MNTELEALASLALEQALSENAALCKVHENREPHDITQFGKITNPAQLEKMSSFHDLKNPGTECGNFPNDADGNEVHPEEWVEAGRHRVEAGRHRDAAGNLVFPTGRFYEEGPVIRAAWIEAIGEIERKVPWWRRKYGSLEKFR